MSAHVDIAAEAAAPEWFGQAALDVVAERRRQVAVGWPRAHDDTHDIGEIAAAAACYALPPDFRDNPFTSVDILPLLWPWKRSDFKPKDRRTDLIRAGALILAEIERLDRARVPA